MSLVNWRKELHLDRSKQIAAAVLSHGWDFIKNNENRVDEIGKQRTPNSRPLHLRLALEELGTTFIKLGQILSTRPDLLPPEYLSELTKLQDSTSPLPFEVIKKAVEAELGQPIELAFSHFDPNPLATASIGQAHTAVLTDGTEVVVKVRRPGVVAQVNEDLEILKDLVATASRHWEFVNRYDLCGLVGEFAETLRSELDYVREGRSAERFADNFDGDTRIHVPRIFWNTTTSRVLTMEHIRGVKISDVESLDAHGIDRRALAKYATDVVLKMVCEDGFFHADPHPGNFFIETDGTVGLIDFGMMGVVDEKTQECLADLLIGITQQDTDRLVDVFVELGVTSKPMDRASVRRDVAHLLTTYWGLPLGELKLTNLLNDIFSAMRRHQMHLPANLALLFKTVIMIEGIGINLDPDFQMARVLQPYADKLVARQYSPLRLAQRFARSGLEMARFGIEAPQQLRRIMSAAEDGHFQVLMRPEGVEPIISRFEGIANRIVVGVIAAAFINGLAVLVSVYRPPGWDRWAWVVFAIGFLCALLLGTYLAWTILRHRRT